VLAHTIGVAVAVLALTACAPDRGPDAAGGRDPAELTCGEVQELPNEGTEHVQEGAPIEPASRPATSGPHYPSWLDPADRVIDHPVDRDLEGYAVHNLEHGYVFMYYRATDVPPSTIEALAALARFEEKVMVARYDQLPADAAVAFTAWQRLLTCSETGDEDGLTEAARDFIERFRGDAGVAPEPAGP
jgi:Protein of unknown function (DUF3105)